MNAIFFFCPRPSFPGYLGAIDADVKEKKRKSVDTGRENLNYRQQTGEKFRLEKACRYMYKKKSK